MTSPSDFLDLQRFEDDGGRVERMEEQWDEPAPFPADGECYQCFCRRMEWPHTNGPCRCSEDVKAMRRNA